MRGGFGKACVIATFTIGSGASLAQPCAVPARDCSGTEAFCGQLMPFEPVTGPGYDNYPINGETFDKQYRSFARRDLQMLVKHAAATVHCRAADWEPGNKKPLGLGDMSESDGAIPGSSNGRPGHPKGTHVNGRDMDIAYYQLLGDDNRLRAVCPHRVDGKDVHHCVSAPTNLDVRRTALFIGTALISDRVRVIGVDGRIRPLLRAEMDRQCVSGDLPRKACQRKGDIAAEEKDTGKGWFRHHHHHFHVSLKKTASRTGLRENLSGLGAELRRLEKRAAPGHTVVTD